MKKILLSFVFSALAIVAVAKPTAASEGIFELRNQIGTDARCYALSVLMQNQNYQVLVSCRDIIYPGGTEVFNYVVWATPNDGGNSVRLGTLDLGKVEFKSKTAFNNIFVTKEQDDRPRNPQGQLVMQGSRQTISILDGRQADRNTTVNNQPNELLSDATPSPSPEPEEKSGPNVFRLIAAGGIIAFLALFGIILVVFVITRR